MRVLHVVNGAATARLLERAGLSGRVLEWADALYDGPVPDVADAELIRIRARYHAADQAGVDASVAGFTRWRQAIADADAYDELVLWFDHDLFDQLNLIHVLSVLGDRHVLLKPVSLVSIDRHPSLAEFKGLGQLEPSALPALYEGRQRIHEGQIVTARRAWSAFRSPDPRAIESLLQGDTSALPFLAAALRRHLEEFPSDHNGLSKSESRLLELAGAGLDRRGAWLRIHEGERAYYLTDMSFDDRLRELSSITPPLLTESFALTEEGTAVLNGEDDRVRLCGIDRWLGGVHLQGRGPLWRWSPAANALRSI